MRPARHPDLSAASGTRSVVLDSNVLFDWLVFRDPLLEPLAQAIERQTVRWLVCDAITREYATVLSREAAGWRLRYGADAEQALATIARFGQAREAPRPARWRCSDPSDQVFLDLALAAGCRWLLTRDRALLKLAKPVAASGLAIVAPHRFDAAALTSGSAQR